MSVDAGTMARVTERVGLAPATHTHRDNHPVRTDHCPVRQLELYGPLDEQGSCRRVA